MSSYEERVAKMQAENPQMPAKEIIKAVEMAIFDELYGTTPEARAASDRADRASDEIRQRAHNAND